MRKLTAIAALFALAACKSEAEAPVDEAPAAVDLLPIGYPDIEANDLFGVSCAYGSGSSMAALVIAMPEAAYIKMENGLIALSVVPGSEEYYGSYADYANESYQLRLDLTNDGEQVAPELINFSGTFTLSDKSGEVLASGTGTVQCGS